jgi:hypothetical protein
LVVKGITMQRITRPAFRSDNAVRGVWEGKRVNYNGSDQFGTVLRAWSQEATGRRVKLSVDWDVQTLWLGALTDSEHVTIVRTKND